MEFLPPEPHHNAFSRAHLYRYDVTAAARDSYRNYVSDDVSDEEETSAWDTELYGTSQGTGTVRLQAQQTPPWLVSNAGQHRHLAHPGASGIKVLDHKPSASNADNDPQRKHERTDANITAGLAQQQPNVVKRPLLKGILKETSKYLPSKDECLQDVESVSQYGTLPRHYRRKQRTVQTGNDVGCGKENAPESRLVDSLLLSSSKHRKSKALCDPTSDRCDKQMYQNLMDFTERRGFGSTFNLLENIDDSPTQACPVHSMHDLRDLEHVQNGGKSRNLGDLRKTDAELENGYLPMGRNGLQTGKHVAEQETQPGSLLSQEKDNLLVGKGCIRIQVYCNYGMLTVHVLEGRYLHSSNLRHPNVYARISLVPDEDHRTHCKTTVHNNHSPVFDEKFSFELLSGDLCKRLLLSVWQKENSSSSEFLGCMSFGIKNIYTQERQIDGWYHLLVEDVGRRKHLPVVMTHKSSSSENSASSGRRNRSSGSSEEPRRTGRSTGKQHPNGKGKRDKSRDRKGEVDPSKGQQYKIAEVVPVQKQSAEQPAAAADGNNNNVITMILRRTSPSQSLGLRLTSGTRPVSVCDVEAGSPASDAGIVIGDRIARINDIDVTDQEPIEIAKLLRGCSNTIYLDVIPQLLTSPKRHLQPTKTPTHPPTTHYLHNSENRTHNTAQNTTHQHPQPQHTRDQHSNTPHQQVQTHPTHQLQQSHPHEQHTHKHSPATHLHPQHHTHNLHTHEQHTQHSEHSCAPPLHTQARPHPAQEQHTTHPQEQHTAHPQVQHIHSNTQHPQAPQTYAAQENNAVHPQMLHPHQQNSQPHPHVRTHSLQAHNTAHTRLQHPQQHSNTQSLHPLIQNTQQHHSHTNAQHPSRQSSTPTQNCSEAPTTSTHQQIAASSRAHTPNLRHNVHSYR